MLKIIPQGAVFAAPHACLELHLVLCAHPESVLPSVTEFFLMGSKDYNSTSLTHYLVNRFGDSFKILSINQCSSQDFFIERGEKMGGWVYCYGSYKNGYVPHMCCIYGAVNAAHVQAALMCRTCASYCHTSYMCNMYATCVRNMCCLHTCMLQVCCTSVSCIHACYYSAAYMLLTHMQATSVPHTVFP